MPRSWALRVRAKSRNTRETRKRQRRDGQSCDSIPLENQCSWSRTSGSRTVAVQDDGTYSSLYCCAPVPPCDTVSAYIILLYISRPGDAAPAIVSAMKTSGDNSKEIRAAPRYITFGVPAVRRPPCSYPPSSSSLDPFACPSPAPPSNFPCLFGPRKSPTVIAFASSLLGSYPMAISRG